MDYFTVAITRQPGPDFAQGLTTAGRGAPDHDRMLAQHQAYRTALRDLGLEVVLLDPLPGFPDAYFVEDVAVVVPEVAVVTRPGAPSRMGEAPFIAPVLAKYRPVAYIDRPGTLEGGDVLLANGRFFIGLSERTNRAGAEQLGRIVSRFGYAWTAIPLASGLHLKSSVSYAGDNTLLVTEELAGHPAFAGYQQIVVHPDEAYAANSLLVNSTMLIPQGCPRLRRQLEKLDRPVVELDMSEARKMDGGLTCMSLRL
jgi:dimethylargininase